MPPIHILFACFSLILQASQAQFVVGSTNQGVGSVNGASAFNTTTNTTDTEGDNDYSDPVIVECTDYKRKALPEADLCISAVQKIPKDADTRTFTQPGDFPFHYDNEKCQVSIELVTDGQERASYLDIVLTVMQMAGGCLRSEADTGRIMRTGGALRGIGQNNRMVLKIGKPGEMPDTPELPRQGA
ncbi:uncharacterized protein KY384_002332 [Bacidia gigantensis]|uniref:uncharacterized protein n=1 Tax=Bacidia gigantensis TaxID=2732470 RepID=UPI001D0563BD|nr:uncharacterized protein KY384_002332 [Bacidia gigantensis]KAG8532455.1 hypothetical protein KY384_002332 [Bacidia gigantensis]